MNLPRFPSVNGPTCAVCLQRVSNRDYIPYDDCSEPCLDGISTRTMGEPRGMWGHLHWICDCGFRWATMTALRSGHDTPKQ